MMELSIELVLTRRPELTRHGMLFGATRWRSEGHDR
jgi:hypothetical protein